MRIDTKKYVRCKTKCTNPCNHRKPHELNECCNAQARPKQVNPCKCVRTLCR